MNLAPAREKNEIFKYVFIAVLSRCYLPILLRVALFFLAFIPYLLPYSVHKLLLMIFRRWQRVVAGIIINFHALRASQTTFHNEFSGDGLHHFHSIRTNPIRKERMQKNKRKVIEIKHTHTQKRNRKWNKINRTTSSICIKSGRLISRSSFLPIELMRFQSNIRNERHSWTSIIGKSMVLHWNRTICIAMARNNSNPSVKCGFIAWSEKKKRRILIANFLARNLSLFLFHWLYSWL